MLNKVYLTYYLAKFKLQTESVRSYLGYLWWILDPLMNAAIYYLLFSILMKKGGPDFIYFLFIGIFIWRWMDNIISKSSTAIGSQVALLKKLYVSKDILVFAEVASVTLKFFCVMSIVYIIYAFKFGFNHYHFMLPVLFLVHFIFSLGIGLFLSSVTPMNPDIRLAYSHFMRLLFYPSGVLFSVEKLPEHVQNYVRLNPLVGIFESYRNILMYNRGVNGESLIWLTLIGFLFGAIGLQILKRYDRLYPKFLN